MALTKATYSMINGAVVNVLDYGADPTGATDSTAAIQAAIDSSDNSSVYVPSGTYLLNSSVVINGVGTVEGVEVGRCFEGFDQGSVVFKYTGSDYAFKINSTDTSPNIVRDLQMGNFCVLGTSSALGAIKIAGGNNHKYYNIKCQGFTNASAKIIYSVSPTDGSWGHTFTNVTVKGNAGSYASFALTNYTSMKLDHCYASTGGTFGFLIGTGVGITLDSCIAESHDNGVALTTTLLGSAPISGALFNNLYLEANDHGIDINDAYPGTEYVYGVVINDMTVSGVAGQVPADDIPILVGKSRSLLINGGLIYSPNASANQLIQIKSTSQETRLVNTYFNTSAGRTAIYNAGSNTAIVQKPASYTPSIAASGGGFAAGNATLAGQYFIDGFSCTVSGTFTVGSTTTLGSGHYQISLPVTTAGSTRCIGSATFYDPTAGKYYAGSIWADPGNTIARVDIGNNNPYFGAASPVALVAGARLDYQLSYLWADAP